MHSFETYSGAKSRIVFPKCRRVTAAACPAIASRSRSGASHPQSGGPPGKPWIQRENREASERPLYGKIRARHVGSMGEFAVPIRLVAPAATSIS